MQKAKDVKICLNFWITRYDSKKNNKENIFDIIYPFSHCWLTEISVTIAWPI